MQSMVRVSRPFKTIIIEKDQRLLHSGEAHSASTTHIRVQVSGSAACCVTHVASTRACDWVDSFYFDHFEPAVCSASVNKACGRGVKGR